MENARKTSRRNPTIIDANQIIYNNLHKDNNLAKLST